MPFQPNGPVNFDFFLSFFVHLSPPFFFLGRIDLLMMFIYLLFLDEWKKNLCPSPTFTLSYRVVVSPQSCSVMLVAHLKLLCPPRSPFLPALATGSSFPGCQDNRGGWPPVEVGEALGCLTARRCAACLLTCRGLGGGASFAVELLLA